MMKVFLDANILYSGTTRSLFIWLHANNALSIFWSLEAWDEAFRNYEVKNGPEEGQKFRASMMRNAIQWYPECMATPTPNFNLGLFDPDDEHIVSAAINSTAEFIITNDKDLLAEKIIPVYLTSPDEFLLQLAIKSPRLVRLSVDDHLRSLVRSNPTKQMYRQSLIFNNLIQFEKWLLSVGF